MNEEFLPNGIHVHELPDIELPWIASITIGPWYYCQGGETKAESIANLFSYMKRLKIEFEAILKNQIERLNTLNKFLALQENL